MAFSCRSCHKRIDTIDVEVLTFGEGELIGVPLCGICAQKIRIARDHARELKAFEDLYKADLIRQAREGQIPDDALEAGRKAYRKYFEQTEKWLD
jgi:hypothetical protein